MRRIRLAYITHGLSANGIESLLADVARFIDRGRFDVTFIIAIDPETPQQLYEAEILSLGMRVIRICDLDGWQKKKRYVTSLFTIFKEEQFDVVHANMDLLNGVVLTVAKKAGIPVRICHAHTTGTPYSPHTVQMAVQKVYRSAMRFLIRRASTARIGCSQEANRYLYKNVEARVLPNGIDLQRFMQARAKQEIAADLAPAAVHLATVGRISTPKNPLFLCEIVRELAKLRQDFVLHWAGTGEMLGQVKDAIRQYGIEPYVQLLGVRSDIPQILCGCSVFVLPSLFEGLGIVLIEAQACGLTCFVSDVVPRQVDAGACRFLPLECGAAQWAREIHAFLQSGAAAGVDEDKMAVFDIVRYTRTLESIYQAE